MASLKEWKEGSATKKITSGNKNKYRVEPMSRKDGSETFYRLRATINGKRVYGGHVGKWDRVEELYPQLAKNYKPRK